MVSLFEPHTRIIPRHKAGTPVEFGRLVVLDEVEGGIVTRFAVLADKTGEQGQLAPALAHHRQLFGQAAATRHRRSGLACRGERGGRPGGRGADIW